MSINMPPLRVALWLLVFIGTLPALMYLAVVIQSGVRGETFAQPVYFRGYYGFGLIVVFVCIAWLAQQLNLWWGVFLGLPALFVGVYPAIENFGSEKLVSRAVVAFDLEKCPAGWDQYENANGRMLVGAGKGNRDEQSRELTPRKRGETGGEEKHKLTIEEMPKHNHGVHEVIHGDYLRGQGGYVGTERVGQAAGSNPIAPIRFSEMTGDSQLHNVMPPFSVVTFCVKQ